jgi:DNA-binding transcriptional LysR family regulator
LIDQEIDNDGMLRCGLKLGHMRMIVALDEHGKVSAAAQVLNISQPAASRMIAEMEVILGVELCERLPRGVALTPAGQALARRARTVLLEMREADREIADLKSGKGGTVSLGSVTAPAIELAVPAIQRIREQNPRIEINIQIDTSIVLARELLASRHDFIIARIPDDLNPRLFESKVIGIEKACLIVRRGHPLTGRSPVSLGSLADHDWVFQPGGTLLRRTIEGIFLSRNAALPERILNTTSLLLTLVMVAQSDAIAPVSIQVARFIQSDAGLAGAIEILPIDFEIVVQPYSLITAKNRILSPSALLLYTEIEASIGREADGAAHARATISA